jgi:hypothetical protein
MVLFVLSAGQEASGQATAIMFRYLPEGAEFTSSVLLEGVEEGPFIDPVEFAARNPGGWGMTAPSSAEFEAPSSRIRSVETEGVSQPLGPQMTVEAWFRSQSPNQTSSLVSNRVSESEGFTIGLENDVPYLEFVLQNSSYRLDAKTSVEVDENAWVAATIMYWQGALTLRLFVDGALHADLVEELSIPSPYSISRPVMVGSSATGSPESPTLTGTFTGQLFAALIRGYAATDEYLNSGIPHDGGAYFGLPSYHDYPLDEQRLPADLRIQSSPVDIQQRFFLPYANDLYIPQGTATRIEEVDGEEIPFVYISYYHRTRKGTIGLQHSIIVEMNARTGLVRRTFRLMGQLAYSHAGGVAYSHNALYISSAGVLERYPLPEWDPSNPEKYLDLEADSDGTIQTPSKASFVSAFRDTLWVGDYRTSSDTAPFLFAHAIDENGRPDPDPVYRFPLPRRIQGVDLIESPRGTVVVLSRNRNSTSAELLRYRLDALSTTRIVSPDSVVIMPHGIEDLSFLPDGTLWTNSESGTDYYQRKSSGAWSSFYPFVYSIPAVSILGSSVSTRQDENPIGSDFDVDVFPNPFVDTLNISLSGSGGADGAVSVFVVDLLGRRIATVAEGIRAGEVRTLTWDAAQIPAGMYFAVIKDGSRRWVKPIIRAN